MIKIKTKGSFLDDFKKKSKESLESVKRELVEELAAATPVDTGEAKSGWRVEGDSIVNDVEHILPLNDGTSKQAPARFIERTLLAHKGVTPSGTIVRSS